MPIQNWKPALGQFMISDAIFCRYFDKLGEVDFEPDRIEVNFYTTRLR